MIVIGSYALLAAYKDNRDIHNRGVYHKDIDLICSKQEFKDIVKRLLGLEFSINELKFNQGQAYVIASNTSKKIIVEGNFYDEEGQFQESNKLIHDYVQENDIGWIPLSNEFISPSTLVCASPEVVLMMKESHKYKKNSVHFKKTLDDISLLREEYDFEHDKELMRIYEIRCAETYNYNHPNLNQKKETFFTDEVPYIFDHDTDLHEAVKHLDKPAYRYYMREGAEVMCDKEKFSNLPEIVKLLGVLEESYVLALERSVIPYCTDPKKAFDMALMKVCTSITSGWFREFAWNNYHKVQSMYHESYVEKFKNHVIKLHGKEYVQNKSKLFRS